MEENLYCLRKGTRLIGRYTIEKVLGQGGFGITYLGMDELHKKKVAIKEFFPQGIVTRNIEYEDTVTVTLVGEKENYDKGKERFLKEAQTMAMFSKDKGIVKALDFFEINNTAYIVMEYLEGVTLKQYLRENERIDAEDLVELLVPLIEALDEIHSQGLIHRDISPDNIMVLPDGRIKLMDFGAARDYTEFGEKSLSIVLKPGYAPPEQYQTHGVQGPWTDIYALCATMYKCITGENPPDAIDRLVDDHLKKISAFGITVSPQIEEAIIKGMSVAAKDRYQNVGDFCEDLYGGYEERSVPEAEESQSQVETETAEANVETKMDMLNEGIPQSKYSTTEAVQENEDLISEELSENVGLTSEENEVEAGIESETSNAGNKVPEQILEKEKEKSAEISEDTAKTVSDNKARENQERNNTQTETTKKQNSTKKPTIFAGAAVILIALLIFAGIKMSGEKKIELGTDPFSYKIEIENQVYAFPTKVSAFTDNGWKVDSKANTSDEWILLQKDGKEIEISVNDDYEIKLEKRKVNGVSTTGLNSPPQIKLPGGLTMNSTLDDLEEWLDNKFEWDYNEYKYEGKDGCIYIGYDTDENRVTYISIWSYK